MFAAKIVADPGADGSFHWQSVGSGTTGLTNVLDTSNSPPGFGPWAASTSAEDKCSLNANPLRQAEDPRVAAGTLTPGSATVPWVAWAEDTGSGKHAIFVARLVGGDHFELFNGGRPVSPSNRDAASADITFFGNVPYVSWIETRGSRKVGFIGHFVTGVFVSDMRFGINLAPRLRTASLIDARVPLSSSCIADPFSTDGSACPIAQVNAPFHLFTTDDSPQRLFGQGVIGGLNCILFPGCALRLAPQGNGAVIQSSLGQSNNVGILVQRVLRSRRVHGHKVLVVRNVGRVPLGVHQRVGSGSTGT